VVAVKKRKHSRDSFFIPCLFGVVLFGIDAYKYIHFVQWGSLTDQRSNDAGLLQPTFKLAVLVTKPDKNTLKHERAHHAKHNTDRSRHASRPSLPTSRLMGVQHRLQDGRHIHERSTLPSSGQRQCLQGQAKEAD
jgi:hypothetical protein